MRGAARDGVAPVIEAAQFIAAATARGFGLWSGVPCSYLTPFINDVLATPALRYVPAANEGEAVAIAAGAELGGLPGIAMFQNSGLGNAVSPLTSLTWTFRIPVLLIVTWRGEPGGAADEPQHELMGQITPRLLEAMDIPWAPFPRDAAGIEAALDLAGAQLRGQGRPFALVMSKGAVAGTDAEPKLLQAPVRRASAGTPGEANATRRQMLAGVQAALKQDDIVIASTGYLGRELYALGDRPCQLYMVGSMGCASSLGLGLALARPDRRIVVIDGDGAALMRLGALPTLGAERPANLLHLLFDNGMHESTGGQATVSPVVDFRALAAASGYARVLSASDPDELRELVDWRVPGLGFIHVPIRPGVARELPRPAITPAQVAARLRAHLGPRPEMPTARR